MTLLCFFHLSAKLNQLNPNSSFWMKYERDYDFNLNCMKTQNWRHQHKNKRLELVLTKIPASVCLIIITTVESVCSTVIDYILLTWKHLEIHQPQIMSSHTYTHMRMHTHTRETHAHMQALPYLPLYSPLSLLSLLPSLLSLSLSSPSPPLSLHLFSLSPFTIMSTIMAACPRSLKHSGDAVKLNPAHMTPHPPNPKLELLTLAKV